MKGIVMSFHRSLLALPLAVGLFSCANPGVSAKVDAAVVGLTAAERAALVYTSLPRCPAAAICSDPATVQRIKDADNTAYAAVKMAEANEALLGAALQAISALTSTVPATH